MPRAFHVQGAYKRWLQHILNICYSQSVNNVLRIVSNKLSILGRPFVKRFALCYRTVVCLSVCLSVCDVGALWPNCFTDQDETWHAGRPRPWPHRVRWEPSSPSPKGAQLPNFRPISAAAKCPNIMGQFFVSS